MSQPPESAGTPADDTLVTPGVTTHAVTEGERTHPASRDVVGPSPDDAAAGGADAPDDVSDAVTREARRTAPGQEFAAGEGGAAGG